MSDAEPYMDICETLSAENERLRARVAKVDQFGPFVLEALKAIEWRFQGNHAFDAALANMRAILEEN